MTSQDFCPPHLNRSFSLIYSAGPRVITPDEDDLNASSFHDKEHPVHFREPFGISEQGMVISVTVFFFRLCSFLLSNMLSLIHK